MTESQYQQECDRAEALRNAIILKSTELMEDECNPCDVENLTEALCNADPYEIRTFQKILETGNFYEIGKYLMGISQRYWIDQSESLAEDMMYLGEQE